MVMVALGALGGVSFLTLARLAVVCCTTDPRPSPDKYYHEPVDPAVYPVTRFASTGNGQSTRLQLLPNGTVTAAQGGVVVALSAEEMEGARQWFSLQGLPEQPSDGWPGEEAVLRRAKSWRIGQKAHPGCSNWPKHGDEDHLEVSVIELHQTLRKAGLSSASAPVILQVGKLYDPDDPVLQLAAHVPGTAGWCIDCDSKMREQLPGFVWLEEAATPENIESLVTAATGITGNANNAGMVSVDLMRVDDGSRGYSCTMLQQLLRSKVKASLVAVIVNGMFPPPLRFAPLWVSGKVAKLPTPSVLYSCSLAYAADVLGRLGYGLLRFSGAYALFAHKDARTALEAAGAGWSVDEIDCYRRSRIYGFNELPLAFVREWSYCDPHAAVAWAWGNISSFYGRPFSLSI